MITYMFPGQGSQYKGMGREVFGFFRDIVSIADDVLGYSIEELCLKDPKMVLGQTQFTQPALYVVSALSYLKREREGRARVDYFIGHSLGEYSALFAAGMFDFETGLRLVKKRGELMSQVQGGGMAVVTGLSKEEIIGLLRNSGLESLDIANHNTPEQIVISGLKRDVEMARSVFETYNRVKLFLPLNVSGAFHSRYMKGSRDAFENILCQYSFSPLQTSVISNYTALPYEENTLKETLANQINSCVRWVDTIRFLEEKGEMTFEEIGPGNVLTNLLQHIQIASARHKIHE